MKRYLFLPVLLLSVFAVANVPELRIGDAAPRLKVKWIKGDPVRTFEKGTVYVLEFWATWCGPCIRAMPHVSRLAKKYTGIVSFIGVSVWERGKPGQSITSLVEEFVKAKGDTMSYRVAMDEADGFMVKNWVEASGQSSIPATIIVDKNGKIAWIGVPTEMDEPLEKIINGTFDAKGFAATIKKQQEAAFDNKKQMEAVAAAAVPIQKAIDEQRYKDALSAYEKEVAQNPSLKLNLASQYYTALVHIDPERTYKEALSVKDAVRERMLFIHVFSITKGLDQKFYQYVTDIYEKNPGDFGTWISASHAFYNAGRTGKAVEVLEKFLHWASTVKTPPPATYLEKEMTRLKQYKEELKK